MSEHITHIAVFEDCVRILKNPGIQITPAFHEAIEEAYDSGLICCGARGNHLYAVPILAKNREVYGTSAYGMKEKEQVAGAIGWLLHRAADLQMKPLFSEVEKLKNPVLQKDECQMYHDAVSFEQVYRGGGLSTNSPYELVDKSTLSYRMATNPASRKLNVDHFENLMAHYYVSQMLRCCVFTDELDNINEFTDKMVEYSLDLYEDLRMYNRAFENPEAFKFHGYISNFNIYDPEDELIQYVRYVQDTGKPHPEIDIEVALQGAKDQSNYAQALKMGIDFGIALSDFFEKKISKEEVLKRCRI